MESLKKYAIRLLTLIGLLTIGRTIVIIFRIWLDIELNELIAGLAIGMLFKELQYDDFT